MGEVYLEVGKSYFKDIEARLSKLETRDFDLKGRRSRNASDATLPQDYVTLSQIGKILKNFFSPAGASGTPSPLPPGTLTTQYAVAYKVAQQTIPSVTSTTLTFDTNLFSTAIHSISSNPTHFTCKDSGVYAIFAQVDWDTVVGLGTNYRELAANVNGSVLVPSIISRQPPPYSNTIFGLYPLTVDDYVEYLVYHDAVGNTNTIPGGTWGGTA